jgi:hypothetical protein
MLMLTSGVVQSARAMEPRHGNTALCKTTTESRFLSEGPSVYSLNPQDHPATHTFNIGGQDLHLSLENIGKPSHRRMSTPPDQPTNARAKLLSHFQTAKGSSEHGQKWDDLWKEGFVPWDKGFPNPALIDLLSERQDLLPPSAKSWRRKALIPGCGKGYDVLLLSAFGYDAYGLEISSNALQEARKVEKEMSGKGVYDTRKGVEKGKITWLAGDFFEDVFLKDVEGEGTFDLIYDYTVCTPRRAGLWC